MSNHALNKADQPTALLGQPTALLSVFDKSGIVELARGLSELGWCLLSSGGTAQVLSAAGVPVTDVADYTGIPIILGHRVATLHPRIHGGILADRGDPEHRRDLETHNIECIDLVVCNLYPFASEPSVEMIDIGGPALLRAAAKNHAYVGVVTNPGDYTPILTELREASQDTDLSHVGSGRSGLSAATRQRLARAAFAHTAAYDAAIVGWFDSSDPAPTPLRPTLHLALERAEVLRYGENPHQSGARYRAMGRVSLWDRVEQLSGAALSYLNIVDADAAWRLVQELGDLDDIGGGASGGADSCASGGAGGGVGGADSCVGGGAGGGADSCAAVIVKHANPCGAAISSSLASAYERAVECDRRSAFGGIVALNQVVDDATVAAIEHAPQADVIVAPGYAAGVVDRLVAKRRATRVLRFVEPEPQDRRGQGVGSELSLRQISDGFLVQQSPRFDSLPSSWQTVSARQLTASELTDAVLAWRVCAHVKSNAVVLAQGGVAWGVGAGQQNRVEAAELAARKAAGRARGGACASDAFYPFADGIHIAADAGVGVVVQPGGSVNDAEIIATADERGLAMLFTNERQFFH